MLICYHKKERITQLSKLFFNRVHHACLHKRHASMAEITVLRTAAHTARISNVITVWTSVVLQNFTNVLFTNHKLRYLMFLGAVLHFGPWLLAIGNNRIGHTFR